jgi:hypothetical protein
MLTIEQAKDFIGAADDATLTVLSTAISEARAARTAEVEESLPPFVMLIDKAGHRCEAAKAVAIPLLRKGTHTVVPAPAEPEGL